MAIMHAIATLFIIVPATAVMLASPPRLADLAERSMRTAELGDGDSNSWRINEHGEIRQSMLNYYDVQYTAVIKMGGQRIKSIVDTGSFELLIFSANCTLCGTMPHLYKGDKGSNHTTSGFQKTHTYGSGTTDSVESFDDMQIGPLMLSDQIFWEVYDANMPVLQEDSFASIFGIGPPLSAAKFAEADAAAVHEQLQDLKDQGVEITEDIMDIVHSYEDAANHAWNATSVVEHLDIHAISICMGKETGTDGFVVWNDTSAKRMPNKFMKIDVAGDTYWSANMTDVKLGSSQGEDSENNFLGCKGTCSAIIDSGTSLIAAPYDVVEKLNGIVAGWAEKGGTCDDLSGLPNLEFSLNGNLLTLPPQSYVGRASGDYDALILGKAAPAANRSGARVACTPLLLPMDAEAAEGPMWILGMPFFREYYTSFIFKQGKAHNRPQPYQMAFSRASDECFPSESPSPDKTVQLRKMKTDSKHGAQLNIEASKILKPAVARGRKYVRDLLKH